MLCPRCGAYSPYNTSVCNRCGAKLSGEVSGENPRSRKYYRNARKSDWEQNRDQLLTKANDALDGILADKRKRLVLFAAVAAVVILLVSGMIGCVSCACDSCGACTENNASESDVTSAADTLSSASDVISPSDETSGSDLSGSDLLSPSDISDVTSDADLPVSNDDASDRPTDDMLVSIKEYIPSLFVDLKYATEDNFTGKVIYDFTEPRLRYGTVRKLEAVQSELVSMGYSLVIWDAYRPLYAQEALWETCPDPAYVSDPTTGYRSHSRGHTVDITLTVIADGSDVVMPSGFDEFSAKADRDYSDVSDEAAANSAMLEKVMTDNGFTGYAGEWWHYSDTIEYPLVDMD